MKYFLYGNTKRITKNLPDECLPPPTVTCQYGKSNDEREFNIILSINILYIDRNIFLAVKSNIIIKTKLKDSIIGLLESNKNTIYMNKILKYNFIIAYKTQHSSHNKYYKMI